MPVSNRFSAIAIFVALSGASVYIPASAQSAAMPAVSTSGSLVIVPAFGQVTHANDEVVATFSIEEQDRDKTVAASRVNQKMSRGIDMLKRADPQAKLKTVGYFTYPVYPEPPNSPVPVVRNPSARVPTAWRVGQSVEVTTSNLGALPKTVASAQSVLTLNNLQFGLSPATTRLLDAQRIAATYQNLNERVAAIAAAMGRNVSDAVIDTVDFEGSGNYVRDQERAAAPAMMRAMRKGESEAVQEPSFEPGETTLQMNVVGKVRFR
jgi:predicted secreted protein